MNQYRSNIHWRVELRSALMQYFDIRDLKVICFDLGFNYEELSGKNKDEKVIEIIEQCRRTGRVIDLLVICQNRRPNVPWDEIIEGAKHERVPRHQPKRKEITPQEIPAVSEDQVRSPQYRLWMIAIPVVVAVFIFAVVSWPTQPPPPPPVTPTVTNTPPPVEEAKNESDDKLEEPPTLTPTSSPTPTSTPPPKPAVSDPAMFVAQYWMNVSNKQYEAAWQGLSPDFQSRVHSYDFGDYRAGFEERNYCSIAVNDPFVTSQNADSAVVTAVVVYHIPPNCTPITYEFTIHLVYDEANNAWLYDETLAAVRR